MKQCSKLSDYRRHLYMGRVGFFHIYFIGSKKYTISFSKALLFYDIKDNFESQSGF